MHRGRGILASFEKTIQNSALESVTNLMRTSLLALEDAQRQIENFYSRVPKTALQDGSERVDDSVIRSLVREAKGT